MTQEQIQQLLDQTYEAATLAGQALERGDKQAALHHIRGVITMTRAALDGLAALPNGADAIDNMQPALRSFEQAEALARQGDLRGALHKVTGR